MAIRQPVTNVNLNKVARHLLDDWNETGMLTGKVGRRLYTHKVGGDIGVGNVCDKLRNHAAAFIARNYTLDQPDVGQREIVQRAASIFLAGMSLRRMPAWARTTLTQGFKKIHADLSSYEQTTTLLGAQWILDNIDRIDEQAEFHPTVTKVFNALVDTVAPTRMRPERVVWVARCIVAYFAEQESTMKTEVNNDNLVQVAIGLIYEVHEHTPLTVEHARMLYRNLAMRQNIDNAVSWHFTYLAKAIGERYTPAAGNGYFQHDLFEVLISAGLELFLLQQVKSIPTEFITHVGLEVKDYLNSCDSTYIKILHQRFITLIENRAMPTPPTVITCADYRLDIALHNILTKRFRDYIYVECVYMTLCVIKDFLAEKVDTVEQSSKEYWLERLDSVCGEDVELRKAVGNLTNEIIARGNFQPNNDCFSYGPVGVESVHSLYPKLFHKPTSIALSKVVSGHTTEEMLVGLQVIAKASPFVYMFKPAKFTEEYKAGIEHLDQHLSYIRQMAAVDKALDSKLATQLDVFTLMVTIGKNVSAGALHPTTLFIGYLNSVRFDAKDVANKSLAKYHMLSLLDKTKVSNLAENILLHIKDINALSVEEIIHYATQLIMQAKGETRTGFLLNEVLHAYTHEPDAFALKLIMNAIVKCRPVENLNTNSPVGFMCMQNLNQMAGMFGDMNRFLVNPHFHVDMAETFFQTNQNYHGGQIQSTSPENDFPECSYYDQPAAKEFSSSDVKEFTSAIIDGAEPISIERETAVTTEPKGPINSFPVAADYKAMAVERYNTKVAYLDKAICSTMTADYVAEHGVFGKDGFSIRLVVPTDSHIGVDEVVGRLHEAGWSVETELNPATVVFKLHTN